MENVRTEKINRPITEISNKDVKDVPSHISWFPIVRYCPEQIG
jgi:hypothetical protein